MKTRYTPLVTVKKNSMQKSERAVESANTTLNSASVALQLSLETLGSLEFPQSGSVKEMLAARSMLDLKRSEIQHNREWVEFAKQTLAQAKEQLKLDMIEYEKFKYLELQEIKKIIAEQKLKEAKELDEIALMTYSRNKERG